MPRNVLILNLKKKIQLFPDLSVGHLFDLTSLKRESGYTINDSHNRKIELNVCAEAKSSCADGAGKHLTLSDTKHWL